MPRRPILALLALLLALIPLIGLRTAGVRAADAAVVVDAASGGGPFAMGLSTALVYPDIVEGIQGGQQRLDALAPPLLRLHAGTDGTWPGGPAPALPAGLKQGDWDFSSLDRLVGNARHYGGRPLLNIRYAPNWMWTCTGYWSGGSAGVGTVRDQTFQTLAAYVARLVAYYNTGQMTAEDGRVIVNPAGTANRIDTWELWNEPDYSNETPCHPADWGPALTPAQYLAMWNAVAPAMRAVDPTVKLVGPTTANALTGQSPEYVPTLVAGATVRPDAISFHGYGGWDNSQSDKQIFDGGSQTDGLQGIVDGLAQVRAWAGTIPVWDTETNVNAAWGNDPKGRPWGPYGVAWDASAFRRLALGGAAMLYHYQFSEGAQFALVDESTSQVYLPYWTLTLLGQAFPPGSALVGSTSSLAGVETLAVRRPDGSLGVLVINRQVDSATSVGGPGLPATVTVRVDSFAASAVRLRQLDATTNPAVGPVAQALPAGSGVTLTFPGYGLAVLDLTPGSAPAPSPTPGATSTPPPPTATVAPTGTPRPTATPATPSATPVPPTATVAPTPTNTPAPTATATPPTPTVAPTATATPPASGALVLYDNAIRAGWSDGSFGFGARNARDTSAYVSPSCSYRIAYTAWGGLSFVAPAGGFDTGPYTELSWAVRTNGLPIADFSALLVNRRGNAIREVVLSSANVRETLPGGWVRVAVPLAQLNPNHVLISEVQLKNATAKSLAAVNIDDVSLLP